MVSKKKNNNETHKTNKHLRILSQKKPQETRSIYTNKPERNTQRAKENTQTLTSKQTTNNNKQRQTQTQ